MKSLTYLVRDIPALRAFLELKALRFSETAKSVLVQVFSSLPDREFLGRITDEISEYIPEAVIVGSTTVGEIINGQAKVRTVVLSFTFFNDTVLKSFVVADPAGTECEAGKSLMRKINSMEGIAGVLMFATPQSISVSKLFSGMSEEDFDFPVFGGGAGVYDPNLTSMIFLGGQILNKGAIAVAFLSKSLHIHTRTFLGWRPLSKEMTITEASGSLLKKIDGERAFDVYSRYLNIPNDEHFFANALEFPILIEKNGEMIARVPFYVTEDGSIGFLADIESGDKKILIIATMGAFSGDGSGCAARLFRKCGAKIVGGLHLRMPDVVADSKMLKKPLEFNKALVIKAKNKIDTLQITF